MKNQYLHSPNSSIFKSSHDAENLFDQLSSECSSQAKIKIELNFPDQPLEPP